MQDGEVLRRAQTRGYPVNEVFYSLQGEGHRTGVATCFIRFSGCNLTCSQATHGFDCDTEFVSGRRRTVEQLLHDMTALSSDCRSVILTGGEPTLHVDQDLVDALHGAGYFVAIETNGTRAVPNGIDWITVSPKVAEHAIRQRTANEVKYVRGYGQEPPKTVVDAEHYFVSPAFDGDQIDPRALAWCIGLVKQNPQWRLSLQTHKFCGIR